MPEKEFAASDLQKQDSTPLSVMLEYCAFNEQDAELLKNALKQWQADGKDLSQALPPTLYAKLKSYLSTAVKQQQCVRVCLFSFY